MSMSSSFTDRSADSAPPPVTVPRGRLLKLSGSSSASRRLQPARTCMWRAPRGLPRGLEPPMTRVTYVPRQETLSLNMLARGPRAPQVGAVPSRALPGAGLRTPPPAVAGLIGQPDLLAHLGMPLKVMGRTADPDRGKAVL